MFMYFAAQTIHFSEIRSFEFWFRIWITLTDELKMETSLPTVRKGSLDKTHVSCAANAMFGDLMSMAKSLACFLIQLQPVN